MTTLALTDLFTNPRHRRRRRTRWKNPFKVNPMTKKKKTGLTLLAAGAAGLLAFFLFRKKAKAEPGTIEPGPVTPPDEPQVIPEPKPAGPKGKLVDVTWGPEDQVSDSQIPISTEWVWQVRPRKVEGVDWGQSVRSREDIASASFVKAFATSPTVKKWPGRKIPAKSDVAAGQQADREKFVNAWKKARTRVSKLHEDYRDQIFISTPGCLVVEIGSNFYNINNMYIRNQVLVNKPASQISEELWVIAEQSELGGTCPVTFAVNTAKKVMAQKFIDEFGAKP